MKGLKQKYPGVVFLDEATTYISENVEIADGVTIYENNRIGPNVKIGTGTTICPNNWIERAIIGENCTIINSHIVGANIGNRSTVGPFARLREVTIVGEETRIGNFVEIKNSIIGDGTKASHLTYIGDAEVGNDCNIGCGTIFANYDGKKKNHTIVEDNSFIGSNTNLIAPVKIGEGSYICAGTTVTQDVEKDSFVIGRVREEIKLNRAKAFLDKISELPPEEDEDPEERA